MIGAVLQGINGLLNPQAQTYGYSLNPISDISSLAKNAASPWIALVETIVVRGGFAVGFGMIAYLGVKTLTGASGSSSGGVIDIVTQQQKNARSAERNANAANANQMRQERAPVEDAARQQRMAQEATRAHQRDVANETARERMAQQATRAHQRDVANKAARERNRIRLIEEQGRMMRKFGGK